nr:hypothetical protein CFP56_42980 [Quercus suber]
MIKLFIRTVSDIGGWGSLRINGRFTHFAPDLDSDSDDDLASPSQSVSVQDIHYADDFIPATPISSTTQPNAQVDTQLAA